MLAMYGIYFVFSFGIWDEISEYTTADSQLFAVSYRYIVEFVLSTEHWEHCSKVCMLHTQTVSNIPCYV